MVDPTGMSYDWVEREDKSVYFDPAAKSQATTKKNERYIGPTADLIDQNGNHHYGDQFGETWRSTSLAEVTITAEMPSHIRYIQAGITMGIYDSHKDFWNSEYTQGGIFMLSNLLGIGETVMALESIYSLGKLAWNGGKALISAAKGGVKYSDDLVKAAEKLYPKKIGKFEKHHPFPKYMGGAEKQTLIELPAPYHQQITNEFYKYWPKKLPGQPRVYPTAQQAQEIMQKVYSKFPLPGN